MKKRIFSWLLILVMAVSLVPVYAFAQEVTVYTGTASRVNPFYATSEDTQIAEDTQTSSYTALVAPITYSSYGSFEDAVVDMREGLVSRNETITVKYAIPTSEDRDERDEQIDDSIYALPKAAMEHTGVPDEGDYIDRHWSKWNASYSSTNADGKSNLTVTYTFVYHSSFAQEKAVTTAVNDLLEEWDLDGASDYEKIETVYDYITETVRYDYTHLNSNSYKLQYTAYGALIDKTAVCQGYANLFYRLMLELGVDCRIISGDGGGPHAWNIVELGGKYYNLDSTWDEGSTDWDWFLLSPANFVDHYRDEEFESSSFHKAYPMSQNNYKPADTMLNITKQPANVVVGPGETAKVKVTAEGEGLTYKWYFKNPDAKKFSYTSSFTGNSYSVTMDDSRNGRQVYCVITDKTGNTIKTKTVKLSMKQTGELTISQQPKTSYTKLDAKAKATVSATGDGLKYQWYVKNAGATKWSKSSITANTYSVTMNSDTKDRQVYCVVTDQYGNSLKTNVATLRMAATITTQPADALAAEGETVRIPVKAVGDGLTYQWYVKNAGDSSWTKSSNTTATYSVKVSSTTKGRQVYCVVKDKYGKTAKSDTAMISTPVKITKNIKTTYIKNGETAKLTVKATGDGLKYQWYVKNAGATKWSKSSVTTNTYTVTMNSKTRNREVYCVVTDKYGVSVKSNSATLLMAVSILQQPESSYTQHGEMAKATVRVAGDGVKYQWYVKNVGDTKWSKSSKTVYEYTVRMTNSAKNRQVYCVITDKYGNTVKTEPVTLHMIATIISEPTSAGAKAGETAKITIKAAGDGLKYQWYVKNVGDTKWSKSSITTKTYSVKMSSASKNRKVYCVVTDKYGNSVETRIFTLKVYNLSATFDLDTGWEYLNGRYCNYASCVVTPGGGNGDYLYKFEVFLSADDKSPATSSDYTESNSYSYWYRDGSPIDGTILQVTVEYSAGNRVVYRLDPANNKVLSKKIL